MLCPTALESYEPSAMMLMTANSEAGCLLISEMLESGQNRSVGACVQVVPLGGKGMNHYEMVKSARVQLTCGSTVSTPMSPHRVAHITQSSRRMEHRL